MSKTINAQSGHTLFIEKIKAGEQGHPAPADSYENFYVVKNGDAAGVIFMYLATGYTAPHVKSCKEVHVFYRNGQMWTSMGKNFQTAIDGAQKDGWMYTNKDKAS